MKTKLFSLLTFITFISLTLTSCLGDGNSKQQITGFAVFSQINKIGKPLLNYGIVPHDVYFYATDLETLAYTLEEGACYQYSAIINSKDQTSNDFRVITLNGDLQRVADGRTEFALIPNHDKVMENEIPIETTASKEAPISTGNIVFPVAKKILLSIVVNQNDKSEISYTVYSDRDKDYVFEDGKRIIDFYVRAIENKADDMAKTKRAKVTAFNIGGQIYDTYKEIYKEASDKLFVRFNYIKSIDKKDNTKFEWERGEPILVNWIFVQPSEIIKE